MQKSIKIKVLEMIKDFNSRNPSQNATKLYLTNIEACEIEALKYDEIGDLSGKIFELGAEEAIKKHANNKFCGLDVTWNASVFKVE